MGTSSQDGGISKHSLPPHRTTAKMTAKLQNKYNPEPSEILAVWKPNNQQIKEVTFIQISRRGIDVEKGNRQSHTHKWQIKIGRDTLGAWWMGWQTPNQCGLGWQKKLGFSGESSSRA